MGLGLFGGGAGAARFFAQRGAEVLVTDLRSEDILAPSIEKLKGLDITYRLGGHEEEDFRNADIVVVNPAVPPGNHFVRIAELAGAGIVTEANMAIELAPGMVIGITGSNGKSTVTTLVGEMLRTEHPEVIVGGNIGSSVLEQIVNAKGAPPVVLELSSYQLHHLPRVGMAPHIAAVLNLTPDHLKWHGGLQAYYNAKKNIFLCQGKNDWFVACTDGTVLHNWLHDSTGNTATFSVEIAPEVDRRISGTVRRLSADRNEDIMVIRKGEDAYELEASALKLRGKHNVSNALAAAVVAMIYGIKFENIKKVLREFGGLPHRLEEIGKVDGVTYINDSMSTTPGAAAAAIDAFPPPIALIAGGHDKGLDMQSLADEICRRVKRLVLIGQAGGKLGELVKATGDVLGSCPETVYAADMDEAVLEAGKIGKGGTVLLSPGYASFDMYPNFSARAKAFVDAVERLREK